MNFKTLLLGSAAVIMTVSVAAAADKTPAKPVAAPAPAAPAVDYVRICSAFGTGYWFAPGLDTCIKLQGTVTFNLTIGDNRNSTGGPATVNIPGATQIAAAGGLVPSFDDDHEFTTAAALTVITTANTEYGQLTGQFSMTGTVDGYGRTIPAGKSTLGANNYIDRDWTVGSAFVQLGPVLAGYTNSAFDASRGFTLDAGLGSNVSAQQIRLAFALGSVGFLFSAEDYRTRFYANVNPFAIPFSGPVTGNTGPNFCGTGLAVAGGVISPPFNPTPINSCVTPSGKIPDLVAAMTFSVGLLSGKVAVGYGDRVMTTNVFVPAVVFGTGLGGTCTSIVPLAPNVNCVIPATLNGVNTSFASYGATIGLEVDLSALAKGDRLRGMFGFSAHTAEWVSASNTFDGNYYSYLASFQHFWAQNGPTGAGALSSAMTASFRDSPSIGGCAPPIVANVCTLTNIKDATEVEFSSTYTIVRNLNLTGAVRWQLTESALATTTGQIALARSWP